MKEGSRMNDVISAGDAFLSAKQDVDIQREPIEARKPIIEIVSFTIILIVCIIATIKSYKKRNKLAGIIMSCITGIIFYCVVMLFYVFVKNYI